MKNTIGLEFGNPHTISRPLYTADYLNFKLATLGLPTIKIDRDKKNSQVNQLINTILNDYKSQCEITKLFNCGINKRIDAFFMRYFGKDTRLHSLNTSLSLDTYGLSRELSLPHDGNQFINDYISSYRIHQGVLHNPVHDRRTTKGTFHIVEGGLDIPDDKLAVPKKVFENLYLAAITPPDYLLTLPYTANQKNKAKTFVSLLVRPIVQPKIGNYSEQMCSEVLFIAPGSLVANLDFVESVFGNAGDPQDIINDAALDPLTFTGHTGYVILAPHLCQLTKYELGLPHFDKATARQKRDGMCYQTKDEYYNLGKPFKITARDAEGTAVTIIADNYFGYSKKEIKAQISFASNLLGGTEEEHSGGALVFDRVNLGEHYYASHDKSLIGYSFSDIINNYAQIMTIIDGNYGIDNKDPHIIYLPENVVIDLLDTSIRIDEPNKSIKLKLKPNYHYILPNGDSIHIQKHPAAPAWKMVKTRAEGIFCHKPCTVSGGGKSEISKSLENGIIYGSYYVDDLDKNLNEVEKILNYNYSNRFLNKPDNSNSRPILSVERTLGSVIKLLTPSNKYTAEYNAYLGSIPSHVKALVFLVKRFYKPEWQDNWRKHFTVDEINGAKGHEVNYNNRRIRPSYLRVGFKPDGTWRTFKLRMDFMPTEKLQMEDDITASITVPKKHLDHLSKTWDNPSYKFTENCEYRFFQRPDEAINIGYDKEAESDLSGKNLFITNFQPLTKEDVNVIKDDVMHFSKYTTPMKSVIENFTTSHDEFCVISSKPRRLKNGVSKNLRYLQNRSDLTDNKDVYIAKIRTRIARKMPLDAPVLNPVNAILPGRRNNPSGQLEGKKLRPLSVYNPLHYQELPELFMDFISSLTGKSPSTTGAGSEGALTKAPFNMLPAIYDLNAALLSYILTDYRAFTTPAGYIGNEHCIDHDISMLIPEIWTKLTPKEQCPDYLINIGALKKLDDFEHNGKTIKASRLGYRMTPIFVRQFMGKVFDEPQTVFTEGMLTPEYQNLDDFADGILNIINGHKTAAQMYFNDGTIELAIPPLKALIYIMAEREDAPYKINDSAFRAMFLRENVIDSEWYLNRLKNKQKIDVSRLTKQIAYIEKFLSSDIGKHHSKRNAIIANAIKAENKLNYYKSTEYLNDLIGTLGGEDIQ